MARAALHFFTWTFAYVQLERTSGFAAAATGGGMSVFHCLPGASPDGRRASFEVRR